MEKEKEFNSVQDDSVDISTKLIRSAARLGVADVAHVRVEMEKDAERLKKAIRFMVKVGSRKTLEYADRKGISRDAQSLLVNDVLRAVASHIGGGGWTFPLEADDPRAQQGALFTLPTGLQMTISSAYDKWAKLPENREA